MRLNYLVSLWINQCHGQHVQYSFREPIKGFDVGKRTDPREQIQKHHLHMCLYSMQYLAI